MTRTMTLKALRSWPILLTIGAVVVVLLVWLVAYFLPQGKKLSSLQASQSQLKAQQAQLLSQLAQLKHDSAESPALLARQTQLTNAVPPDSQSFAYIQQISQVAAASGVTIGNLSLGAVSAPTALSGATVSSANYSDIPVTLTLTATYDEELLFLRNIYTMPRLTVVNSLSLSGGGLKSNRATVLDVSMVMTIFTTAPPAAPGG